MNASTDASVAGLRAALTKAEERQRKAWAKYTRARDRWERALRRADAARQALRDAVGDRPELRSAYELEVEAARLRRQESTPATTGRLHAIAHEIREARAREAAP